MFVKWTTKTWENQVKNNHLIPRNCVLEGQHRKKIQSFFTTSTRRMDPYTHFHRNSNRTSIWFLLCFNSLLLKIWPTKNSNWEGGAHLGFHHFGDRGNSVRSSRPCGYIYMRPHLNQTAPSTKKKPKWTLIPKQPGNDRPKWKGREPGPNLDMPLLRQRCTVQGAGVRLKTQWWLNRMKTLAWMKIITVICLSW